MPVVDTDFLIAVDHEHRAAMRMADDMRRSPQVVFIPAAVWMEYLVGRSLKDRAATVTGLGQAAVLHGFGRAEADEGIRIYDALEAMGQPLAWHDLQVAATARSLGEPLVSNDQAFRRVPGLQVMRF